MLLICILVIIPASWNKSHLVKMNDLFYVLMDSILLNFSSMFSEVIFYSLLVVSLSSFGLKVILL